MCRTTSMCLFSLLLFSCDKEISDVGGEILTSTNISTVEFISKNIETENISLKTIQSNNLSGGYLLGTSQNEKIGNTKYGLLLRAEPTLSSSLNDAVNLAIKNNPERSISVRVKSANMIIPYTYALAAARDGVQDTFAISNIAKPNVALGLDVFRSEYNLESTSTSTNTPQIYYANVDALDGVNPAEGFINKSGNEVVKQVTDNTPNTDQFKIKVLDTAGELLAIDLVSDNFESIGKTLRIALKKDFFGEGLVDAQGIVLNHKDFNSTKFFQKFKGLYLKPKDTNENLVKVIDGNATVIPKIDVIFEVVTEPIKDGGDNQIIREVAVVFDMTQQIVNTVDFPIVAGDVFDTAFKGKQIAVVKGGASASRIKLFSNPTQLKSLFEEKIIVNQAVLRFRVNKESALFVEENLPDVLSINRLESGIELSRGQISKDKTIYDFTITDYLQLILNTEKSDEALKSNIDLIVGVSEASLNTESNLKDPVNRSSSIAIFDTKKRKRINIGSLQSSKEVPLYGSDAPEDKKPQLIIKFTPTK